ncbi:MAG TPA: hydantoinase/oxoprolinase family protein [Vicinamibacteria bacterium]|nr:hydantoinase/oxoprolinase family protein [Vicinamibacteria bacterium]
MRKLDIAVDIGGTFTDLVAYDESTGRVTSTKSSTTPPELTLGIVRCLEKSGLSVAEARNFVHGSTIAINTVIERKGVRTALVVTRGTRDLYKIGRGNRPEAYKLFFKRPEPLVPRHLTFEVDERLGPDGRVVTRFDDAQARAVAEEVAGSGVEAVAVCFLHSWRNAAHEERMGELLSEVVPRAFVTLSHRLLREYGEYERTSTSVINAYIGPPIRAYLGSLERLLAARRFDGRFLIMQSNGGVMTPAVAGGHPVAMLESGPVGGFMAAARVGKLLGYTNVIGFDMGGTTAKTSLVTGGEPRMAHGYHIGGYASGQPVMLPVVDTVEVGSGGGSIAWVDGFGSLQVGPRSAGAEPGPICYGQGGTEPTVTDANLVLGRLSERALLDGEMTLACDAAHRGLETTIAAALGLTPVEAARAVIRIAVTKMSLAVREVSVERGYDPRDFAMVAFGGAGPLHAVEVARELHIPTVIVPNVPGQFSAAGMLLADLKHDYVRTFYQELDTADLGELLRLAKELVDEGRRTLQGEGVSSQTMEFRYVLEIRYVGQEFTLPIEVPPGALAGAERENIRARFNDNHDRQFGYRDNERPVEIVNLRVTAVGRREIRDVLALSPPPPGGRVEPAETRPVVLEDGTFVACPVYRRDGLPEGFELSGPAVIQEYGSTTLLFPGDSARVSPSGELVIRVGSLESGV